MTQLLVFKERVRTIYQKYGSYIEPFMKFILAFVVFKLINSNLPYDERLGSLMILFGLSAVSAFTPTVIMVFLAGIYTVASVYAVSPFLSIIVLIVLLILYVIFIRVSPKFGYVVLGVPVLYLLNLHYIVPILMGLVATPLAIVPVTCGVIVHYLIMNIQTAALATNSTANVDDILVLYKQVMDGLVSNKAMLLTLVIFAIVLVITYLIRCLAVDHAFELSIVCGGASMILFYLIVDFVLGSTAQILKMIVGTILSCIIVYIIQFFRLTLEYSRVEHVQFEDDHYYYYVKAVPKVKVTMPEKSEKRFTKNHSEEELFEEAAEVSFEEKSEKLRLRTPEEEESFESKEAGNTDFDEEQ